MNREKLFIIEIAAKMEVRASEFPDSEAGFIMDKIKQKIFCNRESITLVGSKTEIFELIEDEENEEA